MGLALGLLVELGLGCGFGWHSIAAKVMCCTPLTLTLTLTLSLTLTLTLALTLTLTLALTLRLTYSIAAKVMRCTLRTGEACRRVICCTWVGVGATG